MNVKIKSFNVDMDVKKKAIEFEVRTPAGDHRGDCYIDMTGFVWCRGRTTKKNGIKIKWEDFISVMNNKDSLKQAVNAAKNPTTN